MKKQLLTAALLFALTGVGAYAQSSSSPQDPAQPSGATPPTFPSDRQDQARPDQSRPDKATPDQAAPDKDRMPQSDRTDEDRPQNPDASSQNPTSSQSSSSNGQSSMSSQSSASSQTGSAAGSSDVQSQIQSSLQQQPNLSGVQVSVNSSEIELTGTVATGKDKKQAVDLAKQSANGMKVVNHIKVTGKGSEKSSEHSEKH